MESSLTQILFEAINFWTWLFFSHCDAQNPTTKIPSQNLQHSLSKSIVCGEMNVIPRDQPCWDERRNSIWEEDGVKDDIYQVLG